MKQWKKGWSNMSLRKLIHIEYAIGFLLLLLLYIHFNYSLLLFLLLLLVPDITMFGYIFNPKIGAFFYNIGHHLSLPFLLFIIAFMNDFSTLLMIALIWIAHIYMDRSVGFGLKYENAFKETHLQRID